MTDNDPETVRDLADLNVDFVRAENSHVDSRMETLESQISELEQQVASLEGEKDDLATEKEATEKLLAKFRDAQREKQLNRIQEANAAVDADEEVDISTLEEADVDQLETVANLLESAAGSSGVSNSGNAPDLSGVEGDDSPDLQSQMAEVANDAGLGSMFQEVAGTDDSGADEPSLRDMLDAYESQSNGGGL